MVRSNDENTSESKEEEPVPGFHVGTVLNATAEINLVEELANGEVGTVVQNEAAVKSFTDCVDTLTALAVAPVCSICCNLSVNVLTTCAHLFCSACISRLQHDTSPCPFCRALLRPYNIFHLKCTIFSETVGVVVPTTEHATKMTSLKTLLQNSSRREHVVVLVQWKTIARYIYKHLKSAGIPIKLLTGNDRRVYNTLRWFDMSAGEAARVLVIIVDPLVHVPRVRCVNTVVLFHPIVCATVNEQRALETAALTTLSTFRTPSTIMLKVYRLVTNDTVESELRSS